jgi:hypothetical protein
MKITNLNMCKWLRNVHITINLQQFGSFDGVQKLREEIWKSFNPERIQKQRKKVNGKNKLAKLV